MSDTCFHSTTSTIQTGMDGAPTPWTDDVMVKVDPHAGTVEYQSQTWPLTSKDLPANVARRVLILMDDWIACAAGDCHRWGRSRAKASG
jgi:hypothetical protein